MNSTPQYEALQSSLTKIDQPASTSISSRGMPSPAMSAAAALGSILQGSPTRRHTHYNLPRASTAWLSPPEELAGSYSSTSFARPTPPGLRSSSARRTTDTQARSLSALVDTLQTLGVEIEAGARHRPHSAARSPTRAKPPPARRAEQGGLGGRGGAASEHSLVLDVASAQLEELKERLSRTLLSRSDATSRSKSASRPAHRTPGTPLSTAWQGGPGVWPARSGGIVTDTNHFKDQQMLPSTYTSILESKGYYPPMPSQQLPTDSKLAHAESASSRAGRESPLPPWAPYTNGGPRTDVGTTSKAPLQNPGLLADLVRLDYDTLHAQHLHVLEAMQKLPSQRAPAMGSPPRLCSRCADLSKRLHEVQREITLCSSELAESRSRGAELREKESGLRTEKELNDKIFRFEGQMLQLYRVSTGNTWHAVDPPSLDKLSKASKESRLNQLWEMVAAVERAVRGMADQKENLEKECTDLKITLTHFRQTSSQKEFQLSSQLAEAESERDKAVADAKQDRETASNAVEHLRAQHKAEREELETELKSVHASLSKLKHESQTQVEYLRHYSEELERKMATLAADAREAGELRAELATLHRQVGSLNRLAAAGEGFQERLDMMGNAKQDAEHALQAYEQKCDSLEDAVRSAQAEAARQARLAAERGTASDTMREDLKKALDQLEDLTQRNTSLRDQLLHKQQQESATQSAASLPVSPAAQARVRATGSPYRGAASPYRSGTASGTAPRPPISNFNDGTDEGLKHENRVLAERMRELENSLAGVSEVRTQREQHRNGLQERVHQLERMLEASSAHEGSLNQQANTLAQDANTLAQDVIQARKQTEELKSKVELLQENVAALQAELNASRDELKSKASLPTHADVGALQKSVNDANEKLSIKETEVSDLRSTIQEYEIAIGALEEELSSAHNRADSVVEQYNQLQEDFEACRTRCAELEEATELAEQLGAIGAERDGLVETMAEKEGELMQADGKIQVLRNEVYRLQNMEGYAP
eukprot:gene9088-16211_t